MTMQFQGTWQLLNKLFFVNSIRQSNKMSIKIIDKKFDLDYRNDLIRRKQTNTLIAIAEN